MPRTSPRRRASGSRSRSSRSLVFAASIATAPPRAARSSSCSPHCRLASASATRRRSGGRRACRSRGSGAVRVGRGSASPTPAGRSRRPRATIISPHDDPHRLVLRGARRYERAAAVIRGGISAVVFPEGTRSRSGELLSFKNAPFGLAIAAGVPVVPVYVHNTFEILPKGGIRLRPRPIRILVGEAIPTAGLSLDDRQRLADRTRAVLLGLRARVDSGDASR